jgi:hypothetical protein
MNQDSYNQLIAEFRKNGDEQAGQKRIEYTESRGDKDVLANFKSTATDLDLDPLQVLGIFMKKHWSSIINYIKTGKSYSNEDIEGRIMDLIQYLELTYACIVEKQDNDFSHAIDESIHYTFKEGKK